MASVVGIGTAIDAIDASAAAAWGKDAAQITADGQADVAQINADAQNNWQVWMGLLLAGLGAYKQYKMYDQMGDMYEAQKEYLDKTREILDDNYYNLFKPQYLKSSDHLWGYVNTWGKGILETAAACGTAICTYVRDDNVFNRAFAKVPAIVNKAKRNAMRTMKRGQSGVCCDNEYRFAALQSGLMVKALNIAERYEDVKALNWNQFYWGRMSGAAQMAHNQYAIAANLMNGAASGVTNVVGQMGQSVSAGFQGAQLGINTMSNQANFWGGVGQLGFGLMGQQYGAQTGNAIRGVVGGLFGNSPVSTVTGGSVVGGGIGGTGNISNQVNNLDPGSMSDSSTLF